ncbi:hypothetical protein, partial [Elstera litoralis]
MIEITNENDRKTLMDRFRIFFKENSDNGRADFAFPRGVMLDRPFYYRHDINLWAYFQESKGRYFNAFGIGFPVQDQKNRIIVEINPIINK